MISQTPNFFIYAHTILMLLLVMIWKEHRHRTRWNRLYIPSESLVCDKINDQPHSVFVRTGGSFKLDGEILIIIVAVLSQSFRYFYFKQLHYAWLWTRSSPITLFYVQRPYVRKIWNSLAVYKDARYFPGDEIGRMDVNFSWTY